MNTELQGPTKIKIKELILSKASVEFSLLNGEKLAGEILWTDKMCLCIKNNVGQEVLILKTALAYITKI